MLRSIKFDEILPVLILRLDAETTRLESLISQSFVSNSFDKNAVTRLIPTLLGLVPRRREFRQCEARVITAIAYGVLSHVISFLSKGEFTLLLSAKHRSLLNIDAVLWVISDHLVVRDRMRDVLRHIQRVSLKYRLVLNPHYFILVSASLLLMEM